MMNNEEKYQFTVEKRYRQQIEVNATSYTEAWKKAKQIANELSKDKDFEKNSQIVWSTKDGQ